jgi:hypothetical protein
MSGQTPVLTMHRKIFNLLLPYFLLFTGGILPAGDIDSPPTKTEAKALAEAHVRTAEKFSGKVIDMMVSDPEPKANAWQFISEFDMSTPSRHIHCEDWQFTIKRASGHWVVSESKRGRCND